MLNPGAASPYIWPFSSIIPIDAPVNIPTLGACANAAQSVLAGIDSFSFTTIAIHIRSSKKFFLHLGEQVSRNNRLLASSNVVLWNRAIILNSRFFNKVCGDCFLQKSIAYVLLILKNTLNCTKMPFVFFPAGLYLISLKTSSNFTKAGPFQKFSVDAFYYLCPSSSMMRFPSSSLV